MEPFELTAMRMAARVVAAWKERWPEDARTMVVEHIALHCDDAPRFRAAYLTAFGR
jgi:hypothetical protein